jgi:hypothetical protein
MNFSAALISALVNVLDFVPQIVPHITPRRSVVKVRALAELVTVSIPIATLPREADTIASSAPGARQGRSS